MIRICHLHFIPVDHNGACRFCERRCDTTPVLHLHAGRIVSAACDDAYVDFEELLQHSHRTITFLERNKLIPRRFFVKYRGFGKLAKIVLRDNNWLEVFLSLRRTIEVGDERLAPCLAAISRREADYACSHWSGRPQHCAEIALERCLVDDDQRRRASAQASQRRILRDGLDHAL